MRFTPQESQERFVSIIWDWAVKNRHLAETICVVDDTCLIKSAWRAGVVWWENRSGDVPVKIVMLQLEPHFYSMGWHGPAVLWWCWKCAAFYSLVDYMLSNQRHEWANTEPWLTVKFILWSWQYSWLLLKIVSILWCGAKTVIKRLVFFAKGPARDGKTHCGSFP